MKKISKEIFTPYLYEKDSIRPTLEKPYPCGEWVVATDTKALLMIKKDLLDDSFEAVKYAPNAMKVVPKQNCDLLLERKTIVSALDMLPHEEEMEEVKPPVDCPECEGDGEVEWEYQDRKFYFHTKFMECPCCDGSGVLRKAVKKPTGKMKVDYLSYIILNGIGVWAPLLETLVETMEALGIEEVKILALRKNASCMIQIADGVNFIFMPTENFGASTAVHHINLMPR